MASSTPAQLSFHPVAGHTIRAACEGGAWASDFGVRIRRGIERQRGLPTRLAAAIHDPRQPASLAHPLRALWAHRRSHIASGYAAGQDAPSHRRAPLWKLGGARAPRAPAPALARAPTCSRRAPRVARQALSRLTQALVAPCGARAPAPPAALGRALAHPAAPPHGPQARAVSPHASQTYGSRPLWRFAGHSGALVTAGLRPGLGPPGAAQARRWGRLLAARRRPWPPPPLLGRGDRHGAPPQGRAGRAPRHRRACLGGLAGQTV